MKNINQKVLGILYLMLLGFTGFANPNDFYPRVKIKNNTNKVITGRVYYGDIPGPFGVCKNDSYTIQPWGTWSHSRGSCLIKKITASYRKTYIDKNGNTVKVPSMMGVILKDEASSYTSSGTSYSTFQVTATSSGFAVYRTGSDWDKDIADGFTKVYYSSVDLVNDAAKRTENAASAISKNTQALAKEGINTTSKEFIDLSNEAGKQLSEGVEIVSDAAKDAYEWAEKNACRIAVTTTISVGVVAYFTPKPSPTDPGTITSASMSATALAFIAGTISKGVASQTMAIAATESFMLIPGVKGNVNKSILTNVIANSINSSLDCIPCWGTPAGVGIAVGGAVAPLVAEYVCSDIIPAGFSKAAAIVDDYTPYAPPAINIPTNIALGKTAKQSSNYRRGLANLAIDGNTDGNYNKHSLTHTNNDNGAYWQVDLGAVHDIATIKLYNRTDCCAERLTNYTIWVTEDGNWPNATNIDWKEATEFTNANDANSKPLYTFNKNCTGRWVRIRLNGKNFLSLAEVEVFGSKAIAWGSKSVDNVKITAKHSGKVLDVTGASKADRANVIQWNYSGNNNQIWDFKLVNATKKYYKIFNKYSRKILNVKSYSKVNGGNIIQYKEDGKNNELWKVEPVGDGYCKIVSVDSGKALTIKDANKAAGANLIQWDYVGNPNQQFKLALIPD